MAHQRGSDASGKPAYGPNIVRAWFDTVLRQVLSGLQSEQDFPGRRNWTFRHNTQALEYIASIKA
jgi:hypothetical protein